MTPAFVLGLVSGGFLMVLWSDEELGQAGREMTETRGHKGDEEYWTKVRDGAGERGGVPAHE